MKYSPLIVSLLCCAVRAQDDVFPESAAEAPQWIQLFNGEDLTGWTPKIRGYPLGENFANTFRVENGLLCVRHDGYENFDDRFGHLFWKDSYDHYRLRIEYRFVGEQCAGGPGWAFRNSGVMLHGQSPDSMRVDQEFPVSIEAQMLGGAEQGERHNGNLCTPGTHVVMQGELITRHCIDSTSKTYRGDEWVTLELEVRGNTLIRHWLDGKVVLEYSRPQLDPRDADAKRLLAAGSHPQLHSGTISLQSESHGIEFRKVELLPLASQPIDVDDPIQRMLRGEWGDHTFPKVTWEQVDALLELADDERELTTFPSNPLSSEGQERCSVGVMAMWLIESVRRGNGVLAPTLNPLLSQRGDDHRGDWTARSETHRAKAAEAYRRWWRAVRELPAEQRREVVPFAGTGLSWYGG